MAHPLLRVLFFPARLRLCWAWLLTPEAPGFRLGNEEGWAPFSISVSRHRPVYTMIYKCHQNIFSESEPTSKSSTHINPYAPCLQLTQQLKLCASDSADIADPMQHSGPQAFVETSILSQRLQGQGQWSTSSPKPLLEISMTCS